MYPVVSSAPKGSAVVRMAIALAATRGNRMDAAAFAGERWGPQSAPALALKAAVAAGTLAPAGWGSSLVDWTQNSVEFWGAVSELSLIGRLSGQAGLRRVPLAVRGVAVVAGASAAWVGEAAPTPISGLTFNAQPILPLKIASLVVITSELAKSSDPAAEPLIRADLVRAMAVAIDRAFLDPANAGAVGVSPASITNGVAPIVAGATPSVDVDALIAAFRGDLSRAVFVSSPARFAGMAGPAFLDLGARGGEIRGIPAFQSLQAGTVLALIDPSSIALGIDILALDASAEGDVSLSTTPTSGPGTLTSLWQNNLIGIKATQAVNWKVLRPNSVEYIAYAA